MNPAWGEANLIPDVSEVVDIVVGRTAKVRKILPGFGVQVWVRERGYERENWPWAMLTVRMPRRIKRYPRPFRFPRLVPSELCHCRIGRLEVENVERKEVRCQRCKFFIGVESWPNRIERATELLRKADKRLQALQRPKIQKGVPRHKRKTSSRSNRSLKAGKNKSRVVIRPTRRAKNEKGKRKSRTKAVSRAATRRKNSKIPTPRRRPRQVSKARKATRKVSKARKRSSSSRKN